MLVIKTTASGWFVMTRSSAKIDRAFRKVFEQVGNLWHAKYQRKHFTHAGAREYRYSPRQGEGMTIGSKAFKRSYTGRKRRLFGHTLPLVWSGASRKLAGIRDVRATKKRVRVVIHARTLNRRRRGAKKSMREEMTTISERETRRILATMDNGIVKEFGKIKESRTKRL